MLGFHKAGDRLVTPSARRFKRVCELGPQVFLTERENRVNEGGMRVGCSVLLFMSLPERL